MEASFLLEVTLIGAFAFVVNTPFGFLRSGVRKFSPAWFALIHLPIPLVAWLRIAHQLSNWFIPLLLALSVLGQFVGMRMARNRQRVEE